jgi:hypothetical protein
VRDGERTRNPDKPWVSLDSGSGATHRPGMTSSYRSTITSVPTGARR